MSSEIERIQLMLTAHSRVYRNPGRKEMIQASIDNKEALVSACGNLATWTPIESTGRSPNDTVMVRRAESEASIDWDSPNNLPIEASTFDMLLEDMLATLSSKKQLYLTERVVGADARWALPVHTITDMALAALFTDNMFRPLPADMTPSVFAGKPFTLLVAAYDKLDRARYEGRLRKLPSGETSNMAVAMDFDRRLGIVYGSAYGGSVKKLIFTVMNYYLPAEGILPLHCSANEGPGGDTALLLGLSGTGKTTLSADPRRALLGDDEHGWSDHGIANFEFGCYAKLINLDPEKEPEIHRAVFHSAPYLEHGAIVENTMMYPDGHFDLFDERFTPNSRASYPLSFLSNIKSPPVGDHPKTILFLTADANGVIPPVSRLDHNQAMLWFLMGYTSKLAGTETGIIDPKTVFSRFFGEPFMPRNPHVYASMLGEKLRAHGTQVYLINTGWSGGSYGVGQRMDIRLTREMVQAALDGDLADTECREDKVFHLHAPVRCPGVPDPAVLQPRNTWADRQAYDQRAKKLAQQFSDHFDKAYGDKGIEPAVRNQCPGK
ncbi:MAG: phosphoenolpyruvate carboxykinase (ATP) [Deltaproteobacteria bacterium]|nr:phosphoenolpyruvate carboxykinase (ATP) [Deltaproteobacteria bacterium]